MTVGGSRRRVPVDAGYVTPAFVGTVALTMLLVVVVANLLVFRYADGVLQAAVESGARQAVATGSAAACAAQVSEVIADGLGVMRDGVGPPTCQVGADVATAQITGRFAGWLPIVGDHHTTVRSTVRGVTVP